MIYGKKNFLYPARLEMGFGILFKVDVDSVVRHMHERQPKEEVDDKEAAL